MPKTFIAFIECSLKKGWDDEKSVILGNMNPNNEYEAIEENAEIYLVDIKRDRRLFSFEEHSYVKIINNVLIYDSDNAEEIAIDESKQFPTKARIDE